METYTHTHTHFSLHTSLHPSLTLSHACTLKHIIIYCFYWPERIWWDGSHLCALQRVGHAVITDKIVQSHVMLYKGTVAANIKEALLIESSRSCCRRVLHITGKENEEDMPESETTLRISVHATLCPQILDECLKIFLQFRQYYFN